MKLVPEQCYRFADIIFQILMSNQPALKDQLVIQLKKIDKNSREKSIESESEKQTRKYAILTEDSHSYHPDGIGYGKSQSDHDPQISNISLNCENDANEEQQTTQVEIDLFRGILQMAKSKQLAAICGLFGAFLIHLIVGAIYRWNMVNGYVGYYYNTDQQTPIGAPLAMLCTGLTMRMGYKLSIVYGSRPVMGIAVVIATISTFLSSKMPTFALFLTFHNVLYGFSAGLLFLPSLKQCHRFFPSLKLITNTIILTGTGLGTVLFGAYNIECIEHQTEGFQLSDSQLEELVNSRFVSCFNKMSFLVFVLGIIGVGLMFPMILRNEQRERQAIEMSMVEKGSNFCKSERQSFKSRVFWIVALVIFLTSCGNYYIIMNFKNLLAAQHQKKLFLYWILISGAIGNGLARLIWGFLFSRVGFKILFFAAASLNILAFMVIMLTDNEAIYLIFYTINSISLGGLMVIFPNVSLLIFGKKIGESIYSYYWVAFSLSNFFQFGITLILTNNPTTSQQYGQVLLFFAICVIGAMIICFRQTLQGQWKNSLDLIEFKRSRSKQVAH